MKVEEDKGKKLLENENINEKFEMKYENKGKMKNKKKYKNVVSMVKKGEGMVNIGDVKK